MTNYQYLKHPRSMEYVQALQPHMTAVAMGRVRGASVLHKFGYNPTVGASFETIWSEGGAYAFRSVAATMTVSSSDVDDTAAGAGARTVRVTGLNTAGNIITHDVTMNGQTGVALPEDYLVVYRIQVLTAGDTGTNEGTIYVGTGVITTGVPAVVDASVGPDFGQTTMGIVTVPTGYTFYLLWWKVYSGRSGNANLDVRARFRTAGGAWQTKNYFPLFQESADAHRTIPDALTAGTYIDFQAKASTGTLPVAMNAEFLRIEEDVFKWGG